MLLCRASQFVELLSPMVSPEIVVREARLEDAWEVVETYCNSFFPEYSFPLDFVLRVDRLVAMYFGFSVPHGCRRTCLVSVIAAPFMILSSLEVKVLKLEVPLVY